MTAVYYADISHLPVPSLDGFPGRRAERIRAALSRQKAKQIAYGWLLLQNALKKNGQPSLADAYRVDNQGKPYFADSQLQFSISHSGDFVACGISDEGTIGVDIQIPKSIPQPFYEPYFSRSDLQLLPKVGFIPAWSQKEALLKAIGTGWTAQTKTKINALTTPLADDLQMVGIWLDGAYLAVCSHSSEPDILSVKLGEAND